MASKYRSHWQLLMQGRVGYLAAVLAVLMWAVLFGTVYGDSHYQWDFGIYYKAAMAFCGGSNPYETGGTLKYVYSPVCLLYFQPFTMVDYASAAKAYLILKLIVLIILFLIWTRYFFAEDNSYLLVLFSLFAFNAVIWLDIRCGNITVFQQAILWGGFYCFVRNYSRAFCVLIVAAASFKVVPLCFLGLILFSENAKKWKYLLASLSCFGFIVFGPGLLAPDLVESFMRNAFWVVSRAVGPENPCMAALLTELIKELNRYTPWYTPISLKWLPYFGWVAVVLWLSLGILNRLGKVNTFESRTALVLLCCIVFTLLVPRMQDYSYCIMLVPAYNAMRRFGRNHLLLATIFLLMAFPIYAYAWPPLPGRDLLLGAMQSYWYAVDVFVLIVLVTYRHELWDHTQGKASLMAILIVLGLRALGSALQWPQGFGFAEKIQENYWPLLLTFIVWLMHRESCLSLLAQHYRTEPVVSLPG